MFKKRIFLTLQIICFAGLNLAFAQLPPETPWSTPTTPHPPVLSNPAYRQTVLDLESNCNITRVSDVGAFSNSGAGIQHQYSKVQAWNADQSKIWIGFNWILNDSDYSVYKFLNISISMNDGRWSNVDPNIRYFLDGDILKKVNIVTELVTTLHQFAGYQNATIGGYHGSISLDDRYVVIMSQDSKNATLYDIANDVVVSSYYEADGLGEPSITPWGNYITIATQNDIRLYDLNFNFIRVIFNRGAHCDYMIDADGNQVIVGMCPLQMAKLSDGIQIDLLPQTSFTNGTCGDATNNPYVCGHVSGRATALDGWALISAGVDDCNNGFPGYYHRSEIFLLKLDGSGTIKSFGFSRSTYSNYLAEAKATVRQDGQKVLFTTDWDVNGNTDGTVDYVVQYNTALPIELTDFYGNLIGTSIFLDWTILNTNASDYFIIERSGDGYKWEEIGTKEVSSSNTIYKKYTFEDREPIAGINYYRIKQLSLDQTIDYSQTISVLNTTQNFQVSPNPTRGIIEVIGNQQYYEVYDLYGNLVKNGIVIDQKIDISTLGNSIYFLKMGDNVNTKAELARVIKI